MSKWTLFSNHGHVLLFLSQDPEVRLRDVAAQVGITERAVQKIVRDLQDGGMLTVTKHGRRNRYRIHMRENLRHELEEHCTVGQLVALIGEDALEDEPGPVAGKAADVPESVVESAPEPEPVAPPEPEAAPPPASEVEAAKSGQAERKTASVAGEQGSLF